MGAARAGGAPTAVAALVHPQPPPVEQAPAPQAEAAAGGGRQVGPGAWGGSRRPQRTPGTVAQGQAVLQRGLQAACRAAAAGLQRCVTPSGLWGDNRRWEPPGVPGPCSSHSLPVLGTCRQAHAALQGTPFTSHPASLGFSPPPRQHPSQHPCVSHDNHCSGLPWAAPPTCSQVLRGQPGSSYLNPVRRWPECPAPHSQPHIPLLLPGSPDTHGLPLRAFPAPPPELPGPLLPHSPFPCATFSPVCVTIKYTVLFMHLFGLCMSSLVPLQHTP